MKIFRPILTRIFLVFAALIFVSNAVLAEVAVWESVQEFPENSKPVSKEHDIEIFSAPSTIMINVTKPAKIEIFTILGRLVSVETISPGSYQINLKTHGVYIVKSNNYTFKVAI